MTADVDFGTEGSRSTARWYEAPSAKATLVIAHGAGSTQDHPWLVALARELSARQLEVVTFDFLYAHRQRRAPDRNDVLEGTWREVTNLVRDRGAARGRLFAGGKSMGGRIATQVAAQGQLGELAGLILLGYPLHPPGKPKVLRTAHFPRIQVPALFVQGTRDAFGSPAELQPFVREIPARTEIHAVEGVDHSLSPSRKDRTALARILDDIATVITRFVSSQGADHDLVGRH